MKKKTSIFSVLAFLLLATISLSTSCKKNKKGVLEVHTTIISAFGEITSDRYECYVLIEKSVSLKNGELISEIEHSDFDGSTKTTEYVYWESESASKLGYTKKNKLDSKIDLLEYTSKMSFTKGSDTEAGENGYWGINASTYVSASSIIGIWKNYATGLQIYINGGAPIHAEVMDSGNAFPSSAEGGDCIIDILYEGNSQWNGTSRTYNSSSGWQNSETVTILLSSDKKSFSIGGATYSKI